MEAKNLVDLDLSWCKTRRDTWRRFFTEFSANRHIQKLALAGNYLLEKDQKGEETLDLIFSFIKKNVKLMHLDFTGCFLTADQIRKLATACKYTGSLQCFHLCMNPGLSEELTAEIRQLIKAGPHEPRTRLPPYVSKSGRKTLKQKDIIES